MKRVYYTCQYRYCGKYLSQQKIKRHAKYCDIVCSRAEARERRKDEILKRQKENEKDFYEWLNKHERVVSIIKNICLELVVERKTPISMRGVFYKIRFDYHIKIRNGYSRLMAELLQERNPILIGKFRMMKK